jgi:hypothetical protein
MDEVELARKRKDKGMGRGRREGKETKGKETKGREREGKNVVIIIQKVVNVRV